MTKKEFVELTGENPVDMFGENWRDVLKTWEKKIEKAEK